jgi:hypothetical protein
LLRGAILAIEDHLVVREPNLLLAAVFYARLTNRCEIRSKKKNRNLFQALAASLDAAMGRSGVC